MRCDWCDREAAYVAEREHIRVGICERHLKERMEALTDADSLIDLREAFDS